MTELDVGTSCALFYTDLFVSVTEGAAPSSAESGQQLVRDMPRAARGRAS